MRIQRVHKDPLHTVESERELELWNYLCDQGFDVHRQYAFEYEEGKFIHVDLGLPEQHIAIELDGPEHKENKRILNDMKRDRTVENAGWEILHIPNSEARKHPEAIVKTIRQLSH